MYFFCSESFVNFFFIFFIFFNSIYFSYFNIFNIKILNLLEEKVLLPSIWGSVGPIEEDLFYWRGLFVSPIGSYYEGGLYYLEMIFSEEYPSVPPKVRMRTPIYHPNISSER